jgi:hypothetical protein
MLWQWYINKTIELLDIILPGLSWIRQSVFISLDFFYSARSAVSNLQSGGPGLCIYVPSDRVAQLHPQASGSLFVAFYDSQG